VRCKARLICCEHDGQWSTLEIVSNRKTNKKKLLFFHACRQA
jgi:hypothetical protein